jgi:glutaredoxin 3
MMTTTLTVYLNQPAAPQCERVLEFLDGRGYPYTTVDVISDEDRAALKQRTGRISCPLVVAGDEVVGNFAETLNAERSGRLAQLVAG